MPVRNAQPYLKECMESIVNQEGIEWELIAIDDHSDDGSLELLQTYAAGNTRISVLQNQGRGIIPALRQALSSAQGDLTTRMDADDLMPAGRLEKMSRLLQGTAKTIATGLVSYFPAELVSPGYKKYENWLNQINLTADQWKNCYRECVIASPNWMLRTEDLLASGGFEDLTYPEDYHLALRWYQLGFHIKVVPEVTLLWREHPLRTSHHSPHYQQPAFFDLKIREFIRHDYAGGPLVLWGRNPKTKLTATILDELGVHFKALDLGNYHHIRELDKPQVLVGVYPKEKERQKIENYLAENGLMEGTSWWYL